MRFCCYSGKELERFTHHEEPWILTLSNLKTNDSSNKIISKNTIKSNSPCKQPYKLHNRGNS
ncbi:hypothetical protein CYJ65_01670 [Gardnerella vaginalis]|nr:hypothetical protein CYJ63_03925 [Gardnerella vaginalis]PKZ73988.1 hypothetical protein CYJ65_01670 [Gardnerella vaginalis]